MKKLLFTFLLLGSIFGNAQVLSDYQFIEVPVKFTGFKENQYKLNLYLKQLMNKKNYTVLPEIKEKWPQAANENPCGIVTADVIKLNDLLKNDLQISFTDCRKNVIATYSGSSRNKDLQLGYQEAMKLAAEEFPIFVLENINSESKIEKPISTQIVEIPESGNSMEFKNQKESILVDFLDNGNLKIQTKDKSELNILLIPSSKSGVYHAVISTQNGNYDSLGFFDGKSIEIEFKTSDNQWELKTFHR